MHLWIDYQPSALNFVRDALQQNTLSTLSNQKLEGPVVYVTGRASLLFTQVDAESKKKMTDAMQQAIELVIASAPTTFAKKCSQYREC